MFRSTIRNRLHEPFLSNRLMKADAGGKNAWWQYRFDHDVSFSLRGSFPYPHSAG
jgi:hypothetical protein